MPPGLRSSAGEQVGKACEVGGVAVEDDHLEVAMAGAALVPAGGGRAAQAAGRQELQASGEVGVAVEMPTGCAVAAGAAMPSLVVHAVGVGAADAEAAFAVGVAARAWLRVRSDERVERPFELGVDPAVGVRGVAVSPATGVRLPEKRTRSRVMISRSVDGPPVAWTSTTCAARVA